jgi:hypothetical protein
MMRLFVVVSFVALMLHGAFAMDLEGTQRLLRQRGWRPNTRTLTQPNYWRHSRELW